MSTTLFAHPAARLIKHIPPLDTPHINASIRRDLLGAGTVRGTELSLGVVLADHQGPLQVCSVPDPSMPGLATLVLVVDAQEQSSVFGAQRRAVVPFRLFEQAPAEGAPGLPSRRVYEGLGAGKHGVDGGSLWFVEDEREEGAMDRLRWSNLGRGNRAVWTVWLMGAPAPVVSVLGELLQVHPAPVTKLPPMLEDSFPWRDTYIALPQSQLILDQQQQQQDEEVDSANTSAESDEPIVAAAAAPLVSPAPTTARRNAPPPMPPKPAALRSGTLASPSTSIEAHQQASLAPFTPSSIDAPAPASLPAPAPAPMPTLGTLRNAPRTQRSTAMPDYRHSLVAVDNETGEILGILAQDVRLDEAGPLEQQQEQQEEREEGASPGSSASEEEELVTPLDGAPLGLLAAANADETESGSATPKQASIRRAVGVYYDSAARREASRASSVLPLDTFAPPPVPSKGSLLSLPPKAKGETVRDSIASANFFSAAESGDEEDAAAPPEQEEEEGWARVHARYASAHRPDLLRDAAREGEEDARSDVSGSTVGGPAVRLWRKARGLPKIKPGDATKQQQVLAAVPRRRDASGQRSEDSVRTSRAETALEELESDADEEEDEEEEVARRFSVLDPLRSASQEAEDDDEEEQDNTITATAEADESSDALGHMRTSTSASGIAVKLHGHRSRALMGSSEVRSREDQLWRDAFDTEALPIDAPYTHLTAGATAAAEPAALMERTVGNATKISEEGMEMQTKGERSTLPDPSSSSSAAAAPRTNAALQGGTVLIEFLQGSRIGASILSGPAASLLAATDGVVSPPSLEVAPLRKGAMAYIPVLPAHFLWWLGIVDEQAEQAAAKQTQAQSSAQNVATNSSLAQVGPDLSAVLSRSGAVEALSSVTSSFTSALSGLATSANWLFGGAWASTSDAEAGSAAAAAAAAISEADRDADAAEWEWAVPDFHPDSLASTPRPIYRRRRPNPSPTGGFAVRELSESTDPAKLKAQPGARELVGSKGKNGTQRYSIIHYDAQGVGRRAFLNAAAGGPPVGLGGLF